MTETVSVISSWRVSDFRGLLPKPIIRRNTLLLPAPSFAPCSLFCSLLPLLLPAPLRFLTHASIRFHSIFELATGLQPAKIGLTSAWPQAHNLQPGTHRNTEMGGPKKCSKSRLVKNLPAFCLKNT